MLEMLTAAKADNHSICYLYDYFTRMMIASKEGIPSEATYATSESKGLERLLLYLIDAYSPI